MRRRGRKKPHGLSSCHSTSSSSSTVGGKACCCMTVETSKLHQADELVHQEKVCVKTKTNLAGTNINMRERLASSSSRRTNSKPGKKSVRKLPLGPVMVARIKLMLSINGKTTLNWISMERGPELTLCFHWGLSYYVLLLGGWLAKLLLIESMNGTHLKSSFSCQNHFTAPAGLSLGKCLHWLKLLSSYHPSISFT